MEPNTLDECISIIEDVGKEPILLLYARLQKKKITLASLKMTIEKLEINELFKKKKSVSKVRDETKASRGKVYRALKK